MGGRSDRVISVGLDGAAWHSLDRLIADGELPNFERLLADGARAPLRSVQPPVTCPAWRCSTSGKNPGKAGVYWWLTLDRASGTFQPPDARSFDTADIWEYLSDEGYRCAVVNVPMTYPPPQIDGTVVSGFGAPIDLATDESGITHPPEFESRLREEYDWSIDVDDHTTPDGVQAAYDLIESRFELLLDLLDEGYDYLHATVFYINMLQHEYGDGPETVEGWRIIDRYLGKIDDRRAEDDLLVVYSDHGHQDIEQTFVINKWLLEQGYLTLTSKSGDTVAGGLYSVLDTIAVPPRQAARIARRVLPRGIYDRIVPDTYPITSQELIDRVDWSASDAVALSQGPLYLNRERLGEDFERVRAAIERELKALTNDGSPVLKAVHRAGDVYSGPNLDQGPDLILESATGWEIYGGVVPHVFDTRSLAWTSGNHPLGMLLLSGPDVDPGRLPEQSLLDVMPTVLEYLGCESPRDIDGDSIESAFPERDLHTGERAPLTPGYSGSTGQSTALTDQLRTLGYLD